jgi:hypothetical protein
VIPEELSRQMQVNDQSVQPARRSVFTGETKWEDGVLWYQFLDSQDLFWAGLDDGTLFIEEM